MLPTDIGDLFWRIVGRFAQLLVGPPKLIYHIDFQDVIPVKENVFSWPPMADGDSETTFPGSQPSFVTNPPFGTDVSITRPATPGTGVASAGKFVTPARFDLISSYLLVATFTDLWNMPATGRTCAAVVGLREGDADEDGQQAACRLTFQVRHNAGSSVEARMNTPLAPTVPNRAWSTKYSPLFNAMDPKELKMFLYFERGTGFARGTFYVDGVMMDQFDFEINADASKADLSTAGMAIAIATGDSVAAAARFVDFKVYSDMYGLRRRNAGLLDLFRRLIVRAAFTIPPPRPYDRQRDSG